MTTVTKFTYPFVTSGIHEILGLSNEQEINGLFLY